MRQSNYIWKKAQIANSIKPTILNNLNNKAKLSNHGRKDKNRTDKLEETFYDTQGKQLLLAGGFCRVVSYTEDAANKGTNPTRYFIDYKADENSKIVRKEIYSSNIKKDLTVNEIKILLNLKINLVEVLKLESTEERFCLQYLDSYLLFYDIGACVDFIMSTTTILHYDEIPVYSDIAILSLQDVTAKCIGKEKAATVKEKIDDAFGGYEEYMEQCLKLNKATKNKYQIITKMCDPDIFTKKL